ncbi:MAG: hypothetical protein EXR72_24540 [Myxococcales bacterium]|nr:hypothetical protein [Myxococcales bacterium]
MVPIPLDLLLSLVIGLAFAACARRQLEEGRLLWSYELAAVLSFAVVIRWPVALYFHLVHTAWSWLFLVDPARRPFGSGAVVLGAHLACLLGGWGAGWALTRRAPARALLAATLGAGALALLLLLLLHDRVLTAATYAAWRDGERPPLEGRLAWAVLAAITGTLAAVATVGGTLWSQGRRPLVPQRLRDEAPPPTEAAPAQEV